VCCIYLCHMIIFVSSDVESLFSLRECMLKGCGSRSNIEVVGSRSRSQQQSMARIPIPAM